MRLRYTPVSAPHGGLWENDLCLSIADVATGEVKAVKCDNRDAKQIVKFEYSVQQSGLKCSERSTPWKKTSLKVPPNGDDTQKYPPAITVCGNTKLLLSGNASDRKRILGAINNRKYFGEHKVGCVGKHKHHWANHHCELVGARLCTMHEIRSNVPKGTGCQVDKEYIWTSTPCLDGNPNGKVAHMVLMGMSDKPGEPHSKYEEKCKSSGKFDIRCCADSY